MKAPSWPSPFRFPIVNSTRSVTAEEASAFAVKKSRGRRGSVFATFARKGRRPPLAGKFSAVALVRKRRNVSVFIVSLGRCSVRVGYCVLQVFVVIECGGGTSGAYRGVNEDVAIECGS